MATLVLLAAIGTTHAAEPKKKGNEVKVAPSFAWTASEPLGLHFPATIDTLFEQYHHRFIPSFRSLAWATTGNYGAPGQNQIFMDRPLTSDFFMEDAIGTWLHTTANHRFYNTRIPMTLLSYTTGGDKYSNQDHLQAVFSGNVNRQLQVGGNVDYIYSKGSYNYQSDKNFSWGLNASYMGDRYEVQALLQDYHFTTKESGGITDDRYINDPADVQGGDTRVDNKSIPTHLSAAHSRLGGTHFYMNHRYKVGFFRNVRDSVTDTVMYRYYVPVTSFIWTFDFKKNNHRFTNDNAVEDEDFFPVNYLSDTGTDETTRYWRLRNTIGVDMLEGFNRYAKFGFSAFATHEVRRYTQIEDTVSALPELPEGLTKLPVQVPHSKTQNVMWVGGQLTKQQGALLRYAVTARFGVLGDAAGEIDVAGNVSTRFKLGRDSVTVRGVGYFKNLAAPYLLTNFISNHYAWSNNFDKQQRFRVGGELDVPHSWTNVSVAYETLKNHIYFDNAALPVQHGSAIHVFSATLRQGLHLRAFNWDNTITYQTSSDEAALPLPKLAIYSNLYFKFKIARVLGVQIGVDCNYYTKYYAPSYNPATMAFINQQEKKCGDFLFANVYADFKLKKARFFIMYSHFDQKLFGTKHYFSMPHYPLNPSRFQLGVSVDFVN